MPVKHWRFASGSSTRRATPFITEMVKKGINLKTIADYAGTSVAMIERHYSKLDEAQAANALAGLAL